MQLIMNLKKELKLTKSENDSLRQMVMELSNGDPGRISEKFFGTVVRTSSSSAYTSRSTPSSSRIPSIPPIASRFSTSMILSILTIPFSIPNQITAPQENIVAKETPELIHTKKMLTQFIEENNTLKTANVR